MSRKSKKEEWAEKGLEDWGAYMAAKKAKLEDQFQDLAEKEFPDASGLFRGVAIFVNGYTIPCAGELKHLMMIHGGIYHHYQRPGRTTHLIASNLPYSKIIQYRKSKNPLPLCKPEWITDSIKAEKLLDWRPYLLYNSTSVTQPQLQFESKANESTIQDVTAIPGPSNSGNSTSKSIDSPASSMNNSTKHNSSMHATESKSKGALCSKNEEFLTEFYNNSRLHHISTMGATFKEYINELRSKNTGSFPGLERLKKLGNSIKKNSAVLHNDSDSDDDLFASSPCSKSCKKEPIIMHIDMDCFFVSVGLRSRPELKGLPVAVTHARGNKPLSNANTAEEEFGSMAEIASCSYEARRAGLKNGMFLGQALKLCPNLKTIKYDFEGYKEVSYNLYNTVASYTLDIEAVSCDEMYADISSILVQANLTPLEFAALIREEIKQKTGCPVSTGFGSNKLQARLATKKAKPDGQFHLKHEDVQSYIGAMNVRDIPGVGYTTAHQLKKMNVNICSDVQEISLGVLQKEFGKKTGEMLYNTCRGIDLSKLNIEHVRKSVSTEVNYGIRFENDDDARGFLNKLSKEVCSRLTKVNAKGRCITLKLMVRAKDAPLEPAKFMGHGMCDNFTKSKNLLTPIDDEVIITKEVLSLWEQLQQPAHEIRGIGIQISRLEPLKKHADTYMMKFIAKAKQTTSDPTRKEQETPSTNRDKFQQDLQLLPSNNNSNLSAKRGEVNAQQNPRSLSSNNNGNVPAKKEEVKASKPQGLKAFFAAKKSSVLHSKAGSSHFPNSAEIDEAVLAELPEDIKLEIMEFHKNDANAATNEQLNHLMKESAKLNEPMSFPNEDQAPENNLQDLKQNNYDNWVEETIPASQGIDESVLIQLPEDIKKEILASKSIIRKSTTPESKRVTKSSQAPPENYFKHTKPGKFTKAKLPDIQQLDMAVLIELPDDIRNEIMNHYKSNRNGEMENGNSTSQGEAEEVRVEIKNNKTRSSNQKVDDMNVSFSQVDPDFLAALSEDMREDVKRYCTSKKKEKESKLKQTPNKETTVKAQNPMKLNKRGRKPKSMMQNNVKSTGGTKNNAVQSKFTSKIKEYTNNRSKANSDENQTLSRDRSFLENEINILQDNLETSDRREAIKSHLLSFTGSRGQSDEHREMLTNLVNYLFSLPMQQVKNQMQAWISNSDHANEIDTLAMTIFLSMLPKERQIENLHVLMKTMHRCMTETGSCVWHETYRKTVDHVQHYMQIEYNSNLMLLPIRCDLRECKSDHV